MTHKPGFNLTEARANYHTKLPQVLSSLRSFAINKRAAQRVEPFPYVSCPIVMLDKSEWIGRTAKRMRKPVRFGEVFGTFFGTVEIVRARGKWCDVRNRQNGLVHTQFPIRKLFEREGADAI